MQAFASPCPPQFINESAKVSYVYDGDTVKLKDGRKIRLLGIDTAEIFSKYKKIAPEVKASGELARRALQSLLKSANNNIGLAYGIKRVDHYGRTLAHIFLPNGTNIQAELIAQGHAIAFTTPPNIHFANCYRQQEALARKIGKGIWALPQYQLKKATQLNKTSQGFHRISGRVSRTRQYKKSLSIFLDQQLELKIYKNDMHNFSQHMLKNINGKQLQVRGWIRKNRSKNKTISRMTLRHPDALKVIDSSKHNQWPKQ